MTATPHDGKEEDFQLFLTLLDRDRFEGKHRKGQPASIDSAAHARTDQGGAAHLRGHAAVPRTHSPRPSPTTSPPLEAELYEAVTEYVRDEMNRADQLGRQDAKATPSASRSPSCSAAWPRAPRRSSVRSPGRR